MFRSFCLNHVEVCGFDVDSEPLETKKRIGYLPEHNPLPEEMFIREYLSFVGGMYQVNNIAKRVEEVMSLVALEPESSKKISQLSMLMILLSWLKVKTF